MSHNNNFKTKIITLLLCASCLVGAASLSGCNGGSEEPELNSEKELEMSVEKQLSMPAEGEKIAIIKTSMGDIKVKFFPEYAPKAVENFITHAEEGYYDGIIFHRVMNEFMIQGGDPTGTGSGGESIWGDSFEDEFTSELHNFRGALSMANAGKNTNGSQFFIVQKNSPSASEATAYKQRGYVSSQKLLDEYIAYGGTPWLDGAHTVFGQVFEGLDIVDAIAAVKVNAASKPLEDVTINGIEITEYKK